MNKHTHQTAFVLGGGGARGALQVGALQALLEAGITPDILIGTSIGAIHAAYLAMKGVCLESIRSMSELWLKASQKDFLSTDPFRIMFSILPENENTAAFHQLKEFLIECGFEAQLRFEDIQDVELVLVATDLSSGCPTLFGNTDPLYSKNSVLEAALASACLIPWMRPMHSQGMCLIDGGFVSELPIETAVNCGAKDIYALDLSCHPKSVSNGKGWRSLIYQVVASSTFREKQLELKLAALNGASVKLISLTGSKFIPPTDFHSPQALIQKGYEITRKELADRQLKV